MNCSDNSCYLSLKWICLDVWVRKSKEFIDRDSERQIILKGEHDKFLVFIMVEMELFRIIIRYCQGQELQGYANLRFV